MTGALEMSSEFMFRYLSNFILRSNCLCIRIYIYSYGSVKEWIFKSQKSNRKFENLKKLLVHDQQHSKIRDYIFIGDTGEKDEDASEKMIRMYPKSMKAVFLHIVSNRLGAAIPRDRVLKDTPIYYFRTYVGAATKAYVGKLISADAVTSIINAAIIDIKDIEKKAEISSMEMQLNEKKKNDQHFQYLKSCRTELEIDINEAKMMLAMHATML